MKDIWIVGKLAKHFLFAYIFYIYDVVSSYIESLEILKEETINYNFDERLINDMVSEIEDNRNSAIHYLQDYLEVSFPEISKELHTKKAAFSILEQQKRILQQNLITGQLEEKNYIQMKRLIDKKVVMLNNMSVSW